MGVQFPGKKHYVTLEWPLTSAVSTIFVRIRRYLVLNNYNLKNEGK